MKLINLLLLAILSFVFLFSSATANAAFNPLSDVCKRAPTSPTCQQNAAQNGTSNNPAVKIIKTAVNIIAVLAGVAAVIVVIISGFQFVTAGGASPGQRSGDPNRVKSARASLTGAVIGLVIIALAWTIVTFVADHFIG